jgi:hypothetical protein
MVSTVRSPHPASPLAVSQDCKQCWSSRQYLDQNLNDGTFCHVFGACVTNNNGFWIYWHFFTITTTYNSSHIELILNYELRPLSDECSLEWESKLLYDLHFTANQFVLATSPLRLTTSKFIYQMNACGYSPYLTASLTRGWVCLLQLLLGLASAVILRSEFRGTHG